MCKEERQRREERTYSIPRRSTIHHRIDRAHLLTRNTLLRHLALHEFLIREEVRAVADGFAREGGDLAFVEPCETVCGEDLFDGVEWAGVDPVIGRLDLHAWFWLFLRWSGVVWSGTRS